MMIFNSKILNSTSSILILVAFLIIYVCDLKAQDNSWVQLNGPCEANIGSIISDSSGNLFAGTDGGVYRSSDNGNHWNKISFNDTCVGLLMTDRLGNIYAAAGLLVITSAGPIHIMYGIYKSSDGGYSWNQFKFESPGGSITSLACDKRNYIYAGLNGTGIFRSTDNGSSWNHLGLIDSIGEFTSIVIDDSGSIFVGAGVRGIFRSTNEGVSWNRVSWVNGYSLVIDSTGNIFAGSNKGVYVSKDKGNTWNLSGLDSNYVRAVFISKSGKIFAGTSNNGLYCSTNDGNTWSPAGLPYYIYSFLEKSDGNIFAGTNGESIYKSTDNGNNWEQTSSGLINAVINSLAVGKNNSIFASSFYGISLSTDNGSNWREIAFSGNDFSLSKLFIDKTGRVYFASRNGLSRSTDDGSTWSNLFGNYTASCVTIDSSGTIFAGTGMNGINCSTDDGKTWYLRNNGLVGGNINDITVSSDNSIITATAMSVCRSTNSGNSWVEVVPNVEAYSLTLDTKGNIYAGLGWDGVYRSTDNGKSWASANSLGDQVNTVAINKDGYVFAGTSDTGVLQSVNNGDLWTYFNSGLTCNNIHSLVIDSSGYLYAGTWGHGIFKTTKVTAIDKITQNIPETFYLFQNYPNPFNPCTVIDYQLPKSGFVTLKVYDVLGREVRTLVNGYKTLGKYSVSFDASNYASGVYFYRLKSDGYSSIKKMILIK